MAFEYVFEDENFNFQVNRGLSYGDSACKKEEIYEISETILDVNRGI